MHALQIGTTSIGWNQADDADRRWCWERVEALWINKRKRQSTYDFAWYRRLRSDSAQNSYDTFHETPYHIYGQPKHFIELCVQIVRATGQISRMHLTLEQIELITTIFCWLFYSVDVEAINFSNDYYSFFNHSLDDSCIEKHILNTPTS